MKMLTVSLFVCAMMALTRAAALPEAESEPGTEETIVEPHTDADSWTGIPFTTDAESWSGIPFTTEGHMGGWVPSCPDGWTMFSIHCLLYVPENMTWAEAEHNCQSMNGNLVHVGDTESSGDIRKVMQRAGHKNGQIWVGGCNTEDPSWSWSIYDWLSDDREHNCLQETSGENVSGCLDEKKCDAHLPSICSIIIM